MLSFWERESFVEYDYLVIGGGLVGLSAAAALIEKEPQAEIAVLERGIFPSGASTKNAGFACFGSLTELQSEINETNADAMLQRVERRWKGLDLLKKRLGEQNIGLENYGGYELISDKEIPKIQGIKEVNKLLKGIFPVVDVFRDESQKIKPFGFSESGVKKLIFNPYEAQIHTGKMMKSLQKYVQSRGVTLLTSTEVKQIDTSSPDRIVLHVLPHAAKEYVHFTAPKALLCSNAFSSELMPELGVKPGRGQVLITEPINGLKFKGTFHFDEGFYYFRDFGSQVLFGGGRNQDLETETSTLMALNAKIQADLIQKMTEVILPHTDFKIKYQWAGIMGFTEDRNPILKEIKPNLWAGVGLNGMGVALGSLLGQDLADKIAKV